jgi:hypothetical protein
MTADQFKIACYLAWCGAEATFRFPGEKEYETATAFLKKITGGGMEGDSLPAEYARSVKAYYFVDEKNREAFNEIMKRCGA